MKLGLLLLAAASAAAQNPAVFVSPSLNQAQASASSIDTFRANASAYGFSIDECWSPVWMDDLQTYSYPYYEGGNHLQFQTDVQQVLLRHRDSSNLYCFAYRVVMSPCQPGRYWGFLGIGSYGDDWYSKQLVTTIQFRSEKYHILDWAPQNVSQTYSGTIGIEAGYPSGITVGASVDFSSSDLTYSSHTNVALNKYETVYNIDVSAIHLPDISKYSSVYYGFVSFSCDETVWVDVTHKLTYAGYWYDPARVVTYSYTY